MISEASEEKQIRNSLIDLLHNNEEVTLAVIAKATGLSTDKVEKHSESIKSMLSKLKKIHTSPQFNS